MKIKKQIIFLTIALGIYPGKAPLAATFGEKMARAGMNTLLGMGTVFIVLIFISVIISCFNYIPKLQAWLGSRGKSQGETEAEVIIAEKQVTEEVSPEDHCGEKSDIDNKELVAVIAAAIAALEGVSTEDFVVRSIRKRSNWNRV